MKRSDLSVAAGRLDGVDRQKEWAADVVVAVQQVVGDDGHFAAALASDGSDEHRGSVEEERGTGGRGHCEQG
ncbi:MAG: hypothetical protein LC790_19995 [Actinobacteria bacterium]|nr:hypothetical protein [Actinomycetota bacterium]